MKLYNKTKYPNELLRPLLAAAGRATGARTQNVIVIVKSKAKGYTGCAGKAERASIVYNWVLNRRPRNKTTGRLKMSGVSTDKGFFTLTVQAPMIPDYVLTWTEQQQKAWRAAHCFDGLSIAEVLFQVAVHEWRHIHQYQTKAFNFHDQVERAKHHDSRVWEKDANRVERKAKRRPTQSAQDAILEMALWINEANGLK